MYKWIIIGIVLMGSITGLIIYQRLGSGSNGPGVEIDWRLLSEMDYISGKASAELKALDGKRVKIPGFMVPLEDNMKQVKEFLLVPSPQACIHVPPPPPNQMVFIKMREGAGIENMYGPIWTYGVLKLVSEKSIYGEASFQIIGDNVEAYR